MMDITVILLAGGKGLRMGGPIPKQYLPLNGKPIARHSYDIFNSMTAIDEIVVVCEPEFRDLFLLPDSKRTRFALPGERRQDSVYNGLQAASPEARFICVHDSARPLIDEELCLRVIDAAKTVGASTAAMPLKFTIKEASSDQMVTQTPDRTKFWEIQTPQVVRRDWMEAGFQHVLSNKLDVTDDVSLVELIGHPAKLVHGSYKNIKVTTGEDLIFAEKALF